MNQVNLIGRSTKDPELNYIQGSGTAVCRFTLAVNRPQLDKNKPKEADFINCVSFGKRAEAIQKYVVKGHLFRVTGNIRTGSYDAKDGTKRYTTDIFVEDFEFLPNGSNSSSGNGFNNGFSNSNGNSFEEDMTPVDEGDMPF